MRLTDEQKRKVGTARANRRQMDAYYGLCAALSCLVDAAGDKDEEISGVLVERARLIPGGLRDLRCAETLVKQLAQNLLLTFERDKRGNIRRQVHHLRIKTVYGAEAHKDPEVILLPTQDLALLVSAATEACRLRMCGAGECSRCRLGKVLDTASYVSRGNRAWWEVFDQATRWSDDGEAV